MPKAWVRASLPERGRSSTGWTIIGLQGDHPVDLATADEALSPDFIAGSPQRLKVPTDTDDWQAVDRTIAGTARELMTVEDAFDQRIAVFPLAPVSACISLGAHLPTSRTFGISGITADDRTWAWPRLAAPAQDITVQRAE